MKNKVIFILLFLFFANKSFAYLSSFEGKITKVIDGDTLVVNGETKVRLACVDTYESSVNKHLKMQMQKYNMTQEEVLKLGNEQKDFLKAYEDTRVKIFFDTENRFDKYGRLIGVIITQEKEGYSDILNRGMKYYSDNMLCKQFSLD